MQVWNEKNTIWKEIIFGNDGSLLGQYGSWNPNHSLYTTFVGYQDTYAAKCESNYHRGAELPQPNQVNPQTEWSPRIRQRIRIEHSAIVQWTYPDVHVRRIKTGVWLLEHPTEPVKIETFLLRLLRKDHFGCVHVPHYDCTHTDSAEPVRKQEHRS